MDLRQMLQEGVRLGMNTVSVLTYLTADGEHVDVRGVRDVGVWGVERLHLSQCEGQAINCKMKAHGIR